MKRIATMLAVLLGIGLTSAMAEVTFNLGTGYNLFNDSRWEGQSRRLGLSFGLTEDVDLGFYMETGDFQWTGDVGATPPNQTKLNMDAQAIRITKKFSRMFDVGVDLGSAKIQQGANSIGAFSNLNQNKPFAGVIAGVNWSTEIKEKVGTNLRLEVGYRLMDINDVSTGITSERTLDDLNAVTIGLGFGLTF